MGVSTSAAPALYDDLVYGTCTSCGLLQILTLVDPKILYGVNHNTEVVGKKWQVHNQLFSEFIQKNSRCLRVLEVGDPAAKLAQLCDFLRWYIVEPKPLKPKPEIENLDFIESWIDQAKLPTKIDTIVLSHVFEHLHDPIQTLKLLRETLSDDGKLLLSVPNMNWILANQEMPPAGLHFEHTFYCDLEVAEKMLAAVNFKFTEVAFFNDHSVFIAAEKTTSAKEISPVSNSGIQKILEKYRRFVKQTNDQLHTFPGATYLYGAHFPAQLLISMGLDTERISGVLDNSSAKVGQTLYGTKLKVESPGILAGIKDPTVICQMGPYTDEISRQLKEINANVRVV